MNVEEYSHELSNALYFPESFPTEAASHLYEYQLEGCNCISKCSLENECICIRRSGTYYEFNDQNDVESYSIREKSEIPSYECNDNCKCSGCLCGNRLIQFGPRKNFVVKKCDNDIKGLGLFTNKEIKYGNFVCQYAGEIITEDEAKQRYTFYQNNNEINYIFCIKENFGEMMMKTFIDPTTYGNIGRYINHSCDANCKLYIFRINNMMPILGVFAKQNILVDSEITYNYGNEVGGEGITTRKKCFCLSSNCRKYLPCDISLISK